MSSCSALVCRASGKGQLWFSMIPNQSGRKIGNVSLESYSQIFEETRKIQDPVQFTEKQNLKDD